MLERLQRGIVSIAVEDEEDKDKDEGLDDLNCTPLIPTLEVGHDADAAEEDMWLILSFISASSSAWAPMTDAVVVVLLVDVVPSTSSAANEVFLALEDDGDF